MCLCLQTTHSSPYPLPTHLPDPAGTVRTRGGVAARAITGGRGARGNDVTTLQQPLMSFPGSASQEAALAVAATPQYSHTLPSPLDDLTEIPNEKEQGGGGGTAGSPKQEEEALTMTPQSCIPLQGAQGTFPTCKSLYSICLWLQCWCSLQVGAPLTPILQQKMCLLLPQCALPSSPILDSTEL